MVRRGKDHLRNHLPLLRHRKTLISQITTKEMYEAHDPSSPTPAHPHPERPGGDNTIMIIDNHTPAGAQVVPGEWDSGWSSFHRSRSPPIVIRWGGRLASSSSNLLITPATTLSILSAGALPCSSISLLDRKSTRLNCSHVAISYAVFCLTKKTIRECKVWAGKMVIGMFNTCF